MAQQARPDEQFRFGGVVTSGHPLRRPPASASYAHNARIMDGGWLRTWGGRKARLHQASGEWRWFHEYRDPAYAGFTNHIAQHWASGPTVKWRWFALTNWANGDIETISTAYDGAFSATNRAAICNLRDRVVIYNGLGVKDANGSKPPFSLYVPGIGQTFYMGLDPWLAGGSPPVVSTAGAGSVTTQRSRKIYVGLYNSYTGHFSNGIYCATVGAVTSKTIALSSLNAIKTASHGALEDGYLNWVFYITLDGGEVPYLLMNGYNPYTVPIATTTASINTLADVYSASTYWLDTTKEMPTSNFPPRPMRWVAPLNGRLYGCLMSGGNGGLGVEFSYTAGTARHAGVSYSASADDLAREHTIGNPEESWPLDFWTPTPNGEIPINGMPAPDGFRLLVHTASHTFLLEEAADGIHEWEAASDVHGLARAECAVRTQHGAVWLTQRNQIAILAGNKVEILSWEYQTLLRGKTPRFGTYTLDPLNAIDRVEFYFTDGTAVVHDFVTGAGHTVAGDYTAGATLTSNLNTQYHLLAKQHIWTQAGQPENGREKVADEVFTSPSTADKAAIAAEWRSQRVFMGDPSVRKEVSWLDAIGDTSRVTLEYYKEFDEFISGNKKTTTKVTVAPFTRFQLSDRHAIWMKFVWLIAGRTDIEDHPTLDQYGDQSPSTQWPGALLLNLTTATAPGNRP